MAENALANAALSWVGAAGIEVAELAWGAGAADGLAPDVVVASDCTYDRRLHGILLDTLVDLLAPGGRAAAAFVVSDEASTPAAATTLRAFVAAATARGLRARELDREPWLARAPPSVRAFRLAA